MLDMTHQLTDSKSNSVFLVVHRYFNDVTSLCGKRHIVFVGSNFLRINPRLILLTNKINGIFHEVEYTGNDINP